MSDNLNLATGATSSLAVPKRLYGLDLIRAIAILWVMIYHAANMDLIPDPDHFLVSSAGWVSICFSFSADILLQASFSKLLQKVGSRIISNSVIEG